jgi:protein phosphatase
LVVLIGPSGAGKSTFASKHFLGTEVVSSDECRGLVADDENDQEATTPAFKLLHFMAEKRLENRKLTVIDATNVRPEDRKSFVQIARKYHALPVSIVINPGERVCRDRNIERSDRQFGPHVVRNHIRALKRGIRGLKREGFRQLYELGSIDEIENVEVRRQPLWTDRRGDTGPFDVIGDIHGCCDELETLLNQLGYQVEFSDQNGSRTCKVIPPEGRKAVFVGDLVDRGPRVMDVLRLVMSMVEDGSALCVVGNHEDKYLRWLKGRKVKISHGLAETIAQLEEESQEFREKVRMFLDGLVSHYWLDDGKLCVAHAGLSESMIGRASGAVRAFALYGETTGETDEFGFPVRYNWAGEYRGNAKVVYGHTPVVEAEWLNGTVCLDTGCVFGGMLTALRYPENELLSVPAEKTYFEPIKPMRPDMDDRSGQAIHDDMLDLSDVIGKRIIANRLDRTVTIHEPNSAAALETMSRFAMNPKWLIYLPPTMSPTKTSNIDGLLEHPDEAFDYYRKEGVETVVCQEKHMGSRAVIIVCKSAEAARSRFGTSGNETGAIYTRTGRAFFHNTEDTEALLKRLRTAASKSGLWDKLSTDWLALDAEIMPWSVKAQALIDSQYAPVAKSAELSYSALYSVLECAIGRNLDLGALSEKAKSNKSRARSYADAYRRYCWPVTSIEDYRIATFHILASEGHVHMGKDHQWHMENAQTLAQSSDPVIMQTNHRFVSLGNETDVVKAIDWWTKLTTAGGEGMVVKPLSFIHRNSKRISQPALKVRGKEYLRIIYGPEYDVSENLDRLRSRGLGRKRSLANREFVLGHEGLHRFVEKEPLRRVHECVFGVLALESEPVDPRL